MSKLFGRTLRETPTEAETTSHALLLRAGMIRAAAAGVYSYMPLAWRALRKIERIIREEMDAIGGQEIMMPVLNPAELWQQTGRWYEIGPELVRFKDRNGRDFVLAMTHEEIVTDLARREIQSYRQLPFMVYHIQTKIRDEARPRGGLLRVREFFMKDGYSFHPDEASLDEYYPYVVQAYRNIFQRCGLDPVAIEADPGFIGGSASHEFMLVVGEGEETLVRCHNCGYVASIDMAFSKAPAAPDGPTGDLQMVPTPGQRTIEQVAAYLGVPTSRTLKSLVYRTSEGLVLAVLRGDRQVNERKLAKALGDPELRMATDLELQQAGLVVGFISPVGQQGLRIVLDESVSPDVGYVAGANREDYHYVNIVPGRDFPIHLSASFSQVQEGDLCLHCGSPLQLVKAIELGHVFKLGTKYSRAMGATYLDKDGRPQYMVMGCYGIGTGRLLAAIVERWHDSKGILWPKSVAPFQVQLVTVGLDRPEVVEQAERLYVELQRSGVEVLYDDRDESAGVKFMDADLLGMPLRVTVSARTLQQQSIELKPRREERAWLVPVSRAVEEIRSALDAIEP
jgi:prolyl-tRNA synthetase